MREVLDACCGVGGATRGYQKAGFRVTGVDLRRQPRYCGDSFHQGDAVEYVLKYGHRYDFIHMSPPCKKHNTLAKGPHQGRHYADILGPIREAAISVGVPWVLENTPGAPMRKDLMLCGEMFNLGVVRHRYFEFGDVTVPRKMHKPHRGRVSGRNHGENHAGPYFPIYGTGGGKGSVEDWQNAMGIDWTRYREEINQAIPPAYTEYIGNLLTL